MKKQFRHNPGALFGNMIQFLTLLEKKGGAVFEAAISVEFDFFVFTINNYF